MKHTQNYRKQAKNIFILMKTKQSAYNHRCRCNSFTKISLSRPLLKSSTIGMTVTFTDNSPLWDHKFDASKLHLLFTMRRPPYISLERPNHLIDYWDKLRIFLLQLWILPKIQPWPHIRIQLISKMKGIFPWFSSTTQNFIKPASAPLEWVTEHCNAPPKEVTEC